MTDIATMTPIKSGKAKAPTNGAKAKGAALALTCIAYATKRMEQEEKEQNKLQLIVRSITELERDGHAEFRAELTKELQLLRELRKSVGVSKEQTMGYSFASFEVLVTNWKTISTAVEMGFKPEPGSAFGAIVAQAVQLKNAHAANAAEGEQLPTKRKAGRKATPLIDKAVKAAEELLENNPADFIKFAAVVAKMLDKAKALNQAAPM